MGFEITAGDSNWMADDDGEDGFTYGKDESQQTTREQRLEAVDQQVQRALNTLNDAHTELAFAHRIGRVAPVIGMFDQIKQCLEAAHRIALDDKLLSSRVASEPHYREQNRP